MSEEKNQGEKKMNYKKLLITGGLFVLTIITPTIISYAYVSGYCGLFMDYKQLFYEKYF